jgi:hypothetical protein
LGVRYLPFFFSFFEKNIFGFKTAKEKIPGQFGVTDGDRRQIGDL